MEELISALKELSPVVTALGVGITVFLLGWRIPSRAEMNRMTDNLQKQINKEVTNLQKQIENETSSRQQQIESETSNLQKQIDKVFATSLAITNEIREDMRLMQSQMVRLGEKVDANTEAIHTNAQAVHADISKLTAKVEIISHALQAEVGNRDDQESSSQS